MGKSHDDYISLKIKASGATGHRMLFFCGNGAKKVMEQKVSPIVKW